MQTFYSIVGIYSLFGAITFLSAKVKGKKAYKIVGLNKEIKTVVQFGL